MKQFAIYTACIGGYDNIVQPEVIDERFDYILFTDDAKEKQIGAWKVRQVDYTNSDKTRIARYVKTHPEELLPEYAATLWLDSSLQIASNKVYERFIDLFDSGIIIATVKHPKRDCIYDEAYEVASRKAPGALEYDNIAMRWCHKLYKEFYPQHNGLFETSILFRRNNETIKNVNHLWWECIAHHSKRDQLSFNYVLWKENVLAYEFLLNGEHMMNSDKIRYLGHAKASSRKALHLNKFQNIRYKYRIRNREAAIKQWYKNIKMPMPLLWLYTYGSIIAIANQMLYKKKLRHVYQN